MGTLYENISELCAERNIKPGKMCADTGISRGLITDLKMGRKNNITVDTAKRMADYFGVSVDRVLGSEQKEKSPTPEGVELNKIQQMAWDLILKMDDDRLKAFVAGEIEMLNN